MCRCVAWVDAGAIRDDKTNRGGTRGSFMSSDTSIASAGIKACCACGTDVAGQPRMKDSHGRYWCMPCGEADQRRKAITSTTANCAGCHKQFSKGKLDKHGEHWFCKACLKKRTKAPGTRVAAAVGPA